MAQELIGRNPHASIADRDERDSGAVSGLSRGGHLNCSATGAVLDSIVKKVVQNTLESWTISADDPSVNKSFINWFEGNVAMGPSGRLYVPNDNFFLYAIDRDTGLIKLTTTLVHASGEWVSSDLPVCAASETAAPHRMGAGCRWSIKHQAFPQEQPW